MCIYIYFDYDTSFINLFMMVISVTLRPFGGGISDREKREITMIRSISKVTLTPIQIGGPTY